MAIRKSWESVKCSQCKGKMKKTIADLQIENKRENAPICPACVCGFKRRINK